MKPDKVGCRTSRQTPLALARGPTPQRTTPANDTVHRRHRTNHTPVALYQNVLFTVSATWLSDVFTVDDICSYGEGGCRTIKQALRK